MSSNTYKNLRLFFIVFTTSAFVLGFISFASGQTDQAGTPVTTTTTEITPQQQQQQQQPPPPPPQHPQSQGITVEPAQATALGIGALTGAGALIKSVIDQRSSKTRDKATDKDAGEFFVLISKWIQCKKLYPGMTDTEILDLPISNNPYSAQTLGQAITERADKWVEGNQVFWKIPTPKMSVPTATTVAAIDAAKGTQTIETKPIIPANKPVQQQTAVAAIAAEPSSTGAPPPPPSPPSSPPRTTTNTNTTVGK